MRHILIVKTSSLGDVIHNFPALSDVHRRFPNARIDWAVEEAYVPLVRLHPSVHETIPVAIRRWRRGLFKRGTWREIGATRKALRSQRYDAVVDSQGLAKSAVITRLASGPRFGYSRQSAREAMAARFYDETWHVPRDRHAIERNRSLMAHVFSYAVEGPPDYGLPRERLRAEAAADAPYVVVLHGTAGRQKHWPEASWQALCRTIAARDVRLVLPWGTASEHARSERLARNLPHAIVPSRRPLDAVARLLAGARAVIGVDTGLLHLAVALEIPTVAIFVGSEPALTGPVGRGPIAVCEGRAAPPSVEEVSAALDALLE